VLTRLERQTLTHRDPNAALHRNGAILELVISQTVQQSLHLQTDIAENIPPCCAITAWVAIVLSEMCRFA